MPSAVTQTRGHDCRRRDGIIPGRTLHCASRRARDGESRCRRVYTHAHTRESLIVSYARNLLRNARARGKGFGRGEKLTFHYRGAICLSDESRAPEVARVITARVLRVRDGPSRLAVLADNRASGRARRPVVSRRPSHRRSGPIRREQRATTMEALRLGTRRCVPFPAARPPFNVNARTPLHSRGRGRHLASRTRPPEAAVSVDRSLRHTYVHLGVHFAWDVTQTPHLFHSGTTFPLSVSRSGPIARRDPEIDVDRTTIRISRLRGLPLSLSLYFFPFQSCRLSLARATSNTPRARTDPNLARLALRDRRLIKFTLIPLVAMCIQHRFDVEGPAMSGDA